MNEEIKKIEVSETIRITDSVRIRSESSYLITSNKKKCADLILRSDLDQNDIIDILIALHVILEVSLNTLYRHIARASIKKGIDEFEVVKNIDNISFIDKTILFIYNSKFDFKDEATLVEATKYHDIISTLKRFSELRNKLLHGHSISTIFEDGANRNSELKKKINLNELKEQIKKFRFILEGMRFYFDHLESGFTKAGRDIFKDTYLSETFLPHLVGDIKSEE